MLNEIILLYPVAFVIFFALICLCVGSLLNVIIHRLPLMMLADWSAECRQYLELPEPSNEKINLFFPRSFCPHCNTPIAAWHNIPLLSYCFLLGRSKCCKQRIPLRYPLVEALCLMLSLLAAWHFGFTLTLLFALLFIWIVIAIAFIDLQHQLIPDSLSLGLLWLGLIANTQSLFTSLPNAVLSAVVAYLSLWLLIQLYYLISGKIGMGRGDFKLFAAFGAWFGWTQLPLILLLSSITGAVIGIAYLKAVKRPNDTPIPFGPYLCIAGLIALFYGDTILYWYLGLFH